MLKIASLALATLTATAAAQTLDTGLTANNGGNVGGGLYFNLTVNTTLTITALDCWVGTATAAGNASWELWLGPSTYVNNVTNPGLWTLVGTTTPVAATGGVYQKLSNLVVNPVPQIAAVTLGPGTYGFAFKSVGCSNGYTNGTGCTGTGLPGSCTNTHFADANLVMDGGAAQNLFLSGGIFSPRMFAGAIHYTLGGTPIQFGVREPYGAGCYKKAQSFYEFYPSSTVVDQSNTSMYLTYDAGNNVYHATGGFNPMITPVSANLALGDDQNLAIPLLGGQPIIYPGVGGTAIQLTSVEMSSNGYITLDGTNLATQFNGSPALLLTGQPRIGNWLDMDPTGATGTVPGSCHYDYDTGTGQHIFTWLNCELSGIASAFNSFQIGFFANGDVEFRWGTMSQAGGGQWPTLIGFSPGIAAYDPGSTDISVSLPFSTQSVDQAPLAVSVSASPVINTTVSVDTTGETSLGIGLCYLTLSDLPPFSPVGLDLAIIGAPSCFANVDINSGVGNIISNLGLPGLSMSVALPIPNQASLAGASVYCQSIWLDAAQNAAGILASNAVHLTVGSF